MSKSWCWRGAFPQSMHRDGVLLQGLFVASRRPLGMRGMAPPSTEPTHRAVDVECTCLLGRAARHSRPRKRLDFSSALVMLAETLLSVELVFERRRKVCALSIASLPNVDILTAAVPRPPDAQDRRRLCHAQAASTRIRICASQSRRRLTLGSLSLWVRVFRVDDAPG